MGTERGGGRWGRLLYLRGALKVFSNYVSNIPISIILPRSKFLEGIKRLAFSGAPEFWFLNLQFCNDAMRAPFSSIAPGPSKSLGGPDRKLRLTTPRYSLIFDFEITEDNKQSEFITNL